LAVLDGGELAAEFYSDGGVILVASVLFGGEFDHQGRLAYVYSLNY
jgi:hypothetical protein